MMEMCLRYVYVFYTHCIAGWRIEHGRSTCPQCRGRTSHQEMRQINTVSLLKRKIESSSQTDVIPTPAKRTAGSSTEPLPRLGCLQNVAYTIWPTIWLTFASLLAYLWPTVGLLLAHHWPTCGPLLAYLACIWCTYSLPYLLLFSFAYQIFVFCCTHMVSCFQASIGIS